LAVAAARAKTLDDLKAELAAKKADVHDAQYHHPIRHNWSHSGFSGDYGTANPFLTRPIEPRTASQTSIVVLTALPGFHERKDQPRRESVWDWTGCTRGASEQRYVGWRCGRGHARQNAASDSFNEIAAVDIELRHTEPLIWRRVEVPTSITLKVLHDIIQAVIGWFDCHLWAFTIGKQGYGLPMDDDWGTAPCIDAGRVRLRDVLETEIGTLQPLPGPKHQQP
jgi:hypothetical protein